MRVAVLRILLVLVESVASLHAQNVQPGLETAVKWKWSVLPSEEKNWGLPLAEPPQVPVPLPPNGPLPTKKDPSTQAGPSIAPGDYEVKRGDALAIISRKSGVPVRQLKQLNALTNDIIRVGQVLKIPTAAELAALATPTPAPAPATPAPSTSPAPGKHKKSPEKAPVEPEVDTVAEATLIQVFLDRENFSNGPIDGSDSGAFRILAGSYIDAHPDLKAPDALRAKAVAAVGAPFTTYKLQASDFRFISPPKASAIVKPALSVSHAKDAVTKAPPAASPASPASPARPSVTYEELLAVTYSAYRTPWEFVAERFHCDEAFLRRINSNIKAVPTAETVFKVPNVTPFEIEKCFDAPLRPKADPEKPITATIIGLARLEIRQGDQLIASMPMSIARPGLHGRGSWTILGAIAGPRLATRQEPTITPKTTTESDVAIPSATPPPAPSGPEQILAAGPRNPVGVFWINLAKADSTTPLPYGLHGTAIPYRMKAQQSLGGLRLANWDIARAVRMLPEGTPLAWK
jgi:LysM repeat protein/lipoprotein-anchoring transpeptidase ErfK/SrfK